MKPVRHRYLEEPRPGVVCPFCGAEGGSLLYQVTAAESAALFVSEARDPALHRSLESVIARLWGGDVCSVVRCSSCSGSFSWPFVAGDAEFYNLAYTYRSGYPANRWEFDQTLDLLASRPPLLPVTRTLELGAGDGAFAKRLLRSGFSASSVNLIEYSSDARRRIGEIDSDLQIFLSREQAAEQKHLTGSIGYVFAFQVMEHVSELDVYLRWFADLLAPGGMACISVPNPDRITFNERSGLLLDMPPNHISRLSVPAMSALARRAGFVVERALTEPFRFAHSLKEFLQYHHLRRVQAGGSLQSRLERYLPAKSAMAVGCALALPSAAAHMAGRNDGGTLLYILVKTPEPNRS